MNKTNYFSIGAFIFSFLHIMLIISCSSDKNETNSSINSNPLPGTYVDSTPAKVPVDYSSKKNNAFNPKAPITKSNFEGSWISDADASFMLEMKGDIYGEYYNGINKIRGTYSITNCQNSSFVEATGKQPTCILVNIKGKEACYKIVSIDGVDLKLTLEGGKGKILAFHRN